MAVTIKDVAEHAGVSVSTVSKVLNNWKTISQKTKDKVNASIKALNYTPNSQAVSFARGNTKNIIYLTSLSKGEAYTNPHMFDIMCGVFSALAKQGFTMTLMDIADASHPKETVSNIIARKSADGIVIHGSVINPEITDLILKNNFPHIVIGHPDFDDHLCWIDTNHLLAGQYAAEYIAKKDISPISFIAGKKSDFISHERERGFRTVMLKHKKKISPEYIAYTNSTWQEGYSAAMKFMQMNEPPKAIVCENNTLAVGCSRALTELGLSAPDDIVFMTFDVYPYTTIIEPKPIIVDINVHDMGMQAADMIIRKIENPSLIIHSYTTLPEIKPCESIT
ncbi:transcriptional regulator, LacI family [Lachnospiraceae bacterium KH1T2]|nr:transcriptional regulator, LacI family [Lachnospiraceae bacterium KH1T2]